MSLASSSKTSPRLVHPPAPTRVRRVALPGGGWGWGTFLTLCLAMGACDPGPSTPPSSDEPEGELDPGTRLDAGEGMSTSGLMATPAIKSAEKKIAEGDAAGALSDLDAEIEKASVSKDPGIADLHFVRGNALSHLDRDEEAMSAYTEATALDPGHYRAYAAMGTLAAYGAGDLEAGAAHLEKAVELNARFADGFVSLGAVYLDAGKLDASAKALDQALAQEPQNLDALYLRAQAHRAAGELDQAASRLGAAIDLEPGPAGADLRIVRAQTLAQAGKVEQAAKALEETSALAPEVPELQIAVVRELIRVGRPALAEPRAAALAQQLPEAAPVQVVWGMSLAAQAKIDEALARFDQAIQLQVGSPAAHARKIETLVGAKRCKDARSALVAFEKAVAGVDGAAKRLEKARQDAESCSP